MQASKLFRDFFKSEKAAGIILILCTLLSLVLSNSPISASYLDLWNHQLAGHSLVHWINDGLMTIFFLMIGLELEREIFLGELSKIKNAMLPIFGAIGGMVVPAFIFLLFNFGSATQSGAGIPMATDIAFAIGILSLLGNRVPTSLKIFLTALAVIDDLGAILVIAFFYTQTMLWSKLLIALVIWLLLYLMGKRLGVRNLIPYLVGGIAMWYFMAQSGIHATITGVLLAFAIPFGNGGDQSTSFMLQKALHRPVAYVILPFFALANTAIQLNSDSLDSLSESYSIGVALGLIIGKPLGIFLLTYMATKIGICSLPQGLKWQHLIGVGILGGIGFTMSIFITLLAYDNQIIIDNTKLTILLSSMISAILGLIFLRQSLKGIIKLKL